MKLIKQSHEILYPSLKDGAQIWTQLRSLIELAGRTCYKSHSTGNPKPFITGLVKSGHHSVIEHANITVRFITDRGVTHELVRHRLAAYSQESTRYCDYGGSNEVVFIYPVWWEEGNTSAEHLWQTCMADAELYYKKLRDLGWTPQQARSVLPNSLKTEIVMTANLREWMHVLKLRCSKAAHPQIRALMIPLLFEMQQYLPEIFSEKESS